MDFEEQLSSIPSSFWNLPYTVSIASKNKKRLPLSALTSAFHDYAQGSEIYCPVNGITELSPYQSLFHFRDESSFLAIAVHDSFVVNSKMYYIAIVDHKLCRVTITYLPAIVKKSIVYESLSRFGVILKMQQDYFEIPECPGLCIYKSTRNVIMELDTPLPDIITIAGHKALCSYYKSNLYCGKSHFISREMSQMHVLPEGSDEDGSIVSQLDPQGRMVTAKNSKEGHSRKNKQFMSRCNSGFEELQNSSRHLGLNSLKEEDPCQPEDPSSSCVASEITCPQESLHGKILSKIKKNYLKSVESEVQIMSVPEVSFHNTFPQDPEVVKKRHAKKKLDCNSIKAASDTVNFYKSLMKTFKIYRRSAVSRKDCVFWNSSFSRLFSKRRRFASQTWRQSKVLSCPAFKKLCNDFFNPHFEAPAKQMVRFNERLNFLATAYAKELLTEEELYYFQKLFRIHKYYLFLYPHTVMETEEFWKFKEFEEKEAKKDLHC